MAGISEANLGRSIDNFCMAIAMRFDEVVVHGLKTAVERDVAGANVNAAASGWVTKGYLTQADADAIAALVTARDTPPEPEPEEPEPTEPGEGEGE